MRTKTSCASPIRNSIDRNLLIGLLFVIAALLGTSAAGAASPAAQDVFMAVPRKAVVNTAHVPDGGIVPDVVLDEKGILHLVYGKGMNAYYAQSKDDGKTFSAPVRLNKRPDTVTVGGERGPKLAIGKNGVLHAVWQGHYQKGGGVWVTRSLNNGKTFAPERNVLDTNVGIDEPTLTANSSGNVVVLWLDGRVPQDKENQVANPLFMARSTDNGATFGPNQMLKTDFPGRGCSCCSLQARIHGPDLYVAFRTGYRNIRDMYLLRGPLKGNDFHATQISADHWKIEGCPMSGPRFAWPSWWMGGSGGHDEIFSARFLVSWMSDGKVYWSHSEDGGKSFSERIPAPDGGDGNYPTVKGGPNYVLLLWTRDGQTHWAAYRLDEAASDQPMPVNDSMPQLVRTGTAGAATGRPTAFVCIGNTFVIVE